MPRKKYNFIQQTTAVIFLMFITFVVVFNTPQHAHAAPWLGEPIYQVLNNTSSGMGKITAEVWTITMNVVNSFVLALLIYVAFMNILRIQMDSYAVKKFLPTFIMTIILANFSFLIARIILDLGNIVISIFLVGNQENALTGTFDNLVRCNDAGDPGCPIAPGSETAGDNYYAVINAYIFKQFFVIAGAIMMFILSFIFLVRNYMLYFLIAIAPLGFLAMALPITKKYFQQWWGTFTKWVFMPVVSVFWLWLGGQFVSAVDTGYWILPVAFGGLCLYMAITSPFKIGGAAIGAWTKLGKQAWGKTGGQVTGYAKKRVGEEYGHQKQKVINWASNRAVIPTRRGWMTSRQTEAFRRQRFAGPNLVAAKQTDDADARALKTLLDDHASGRRRLPSSIASRYNAQLRKRYMDEASSLRDAGVGTLLDNNLRTLDNGMLAMPTFNQGIGVFNAEQDPEEALKQHMARIAAVKTTLGKARNNRDRERLVAALSETQDDGNTRLGQLLGQRIEDADDPMFERGLDTLRALDIGPYNNNPGGGERDALLEDASAYRLRGGAIPAAAPGATTSAAPATGVTPIVLGPTGQAYSRALVDPEGNPISSSSTQTEQRVASAIFEDSELAGYMRELVDEFRNLEQTLGGHGSLGGEGGYDQLVGEISKMKPNLTLSDAGLAAAILPVMKVRIESMDPTALEQWGRKIRQVSEGVNKMTDGIEAENASVLRQIATVIRNGANPSKLAEGRQAIGEAADTDEGEGNG